MANLHRRRGVPLGPLQPPPLGARIDWEDYFAKGLGFCAVPSERAGIGTIDLVSSTIGTTGYTSNAAWNGGLLGGGVMAPGGANVAGKGGFLWSNKTIGDVTATGANATFTVECLCSFTTLTIPTNTQFLSKNTDVVGGGAQGGWICRQPNSGTIDFVALDSGSVGLNMRITFPSQAAFKLYHIVWTYNKGTGTIYVNGRSIGTGSGTPGSISNTSGLQLGKVTDGSSAFPGVIYLARMWPTRLLSASEVFELYTDPFGMFIYPGRRLTNAKFLAALRRRMIIWS